MSFLSGLDLGGNSFSGQSQTTAFDFGNFTNAVTSNASDGQGGIDAGSAVNAGLDVAASAIPFGTVVKGFLDKMGLSENIGLVSKYGLSSWGGSNSPEKMAKHFADNVFPRVHQLMQGINQGRVEETVNQMEVFFQVLEDSYNHKKSAHSSAKSTRLANEWGAKTVRGLRTKFRQEITALKSKAFDIQTTTASINVSSMQSIFDGLFIHFDHQASTVNVKQYIFSEKNNIEVNDKGEIVKKSSNSLLLLGGGILAAVKGGLLKI